jgi:oligoendopeptidase F
MPTHTNYKTDWNLKELYPSMKDLDNHVEVIDKAYSAFAKKYKNKSDYLKDEKKLLKALKDYGSLLEVTPTKPIIYLWLLQTLDSSDLEIEAKLNKVSQAMTETANKVLFFELNLGKIPSSLQKKFLKSEQLKTYHYMLRELFREAKHHLSEAEEKILNLKQLTSYSLWVQGVEKHTSKLSVPIKGEDMPLAELFSKLPDLPTPTRRKAWNAAMQELKKVKEFSESEINAVITDKKISDELRGFANPWSATVMSYQNDEKSVLSLVDTITKHFKISRRFYTLKKKLLSLDTLYYADRSVSPGKLRQTFTFDESVEILTRVFKTTDPQFETILNTMLQKGHIDVFPRKYRQGGAFCLGDTGVPTYVFLNHTNNLNSLTTFAHEMGHAIHTELSKTQPLMYQNYSTAVAETASTFFESLVFEDIFKELTQKEQIVALHDKIQDSVQTTFRQIAAFNFERELHETIRSKGSMSHTEIALLLNRHMSSYLGKDVIMQEDDGYSFITWSHFRRPFYVYAYAYGELISNALYEKYKEDPHFIEKVKQFLKAGESKSPEDIFKDIGIDTTKPDFFELGLKKIERDIKRLEKLIAQ